MNRQDAGPNRRRFLAAAGAGPGRVSVAGLAAARSGGNHGKRAGQHTHRLAGSGESHDLQNQHDVLEMLLSDPRLPKVIDESSSAARYSVRAARQRS
jgi:hypothetical protein